MARNGEAALKFTEDLHDRIADAFRKDTEELQSWKAEQTRDGARADATLGGELLG